jgi:hypothetical protein
MQSSIAVVTSEGIALVSLDGGQPQVVRGSQPGDMPLHWVRDGSALFIGQRGTTACPAERLNVNTGLRAMWKTFSPADVAGVTGVACPVISGDEQHYVFGYIRNLSDLFLVEHLQ